MRSQESGHTSAYAEPVPDSVNAQFWEMVLEMHENEITNVVHKDHI